MRPLSKSAAHIAARQIESGKTETYALEAGTSIRDVLSTVAAQAKANVMQSSAITLPSAVAFSQEAAKNHTRGVFGKRCVACRRSGAGHTGWKTEKDATEAALAVARAIAEGRSGRSSQRSNCAQASANGYSQSVIKAAGTSAATAMNLETAMLWLRCCNNKPI